MIAKLVIENIRETSIKKTVSKRIEKALDKAQDFYEKSKYFNFTKDDVYVEYGLEELEDGDTSLFINDINIHPYYQNKGYASKILREICNYGDNNDLPISLRASVGGHYNSPTRITQDKLIKWYEKFGFVLSPDGSKFKGDDIFMIRFPNKLSESISFQRGLDPKEAMGIGRYAWHNGWRLVQEPIRELTEEERYAISDVNFTRKPTEPADVYTKTEVTKKLGNILENLPIIDFKSNYSMPGSIGLFVYDDWPEDFPKYQLFVTNVEEDEGITYLVNTEGSRYPRYMTQLV